MTSGSNQLHLPGHAEVELRQRLDDTILWLEIRAYICKQSLGEAFQLDRIWPENTVPRQHEFADLLQCTRRLHSLVQTLLERMAAHGMHLAAAVGLATRLGVELPQSILEKL